ncbi:hypothetical protein BU16DRAFT_538418 [Lophium mytilinum]|uniref:F-box domain-containing protein n=1 Tax=Lophium mytilinum TaxID=390894 RepID=A0A6A6QVP1_9PEZI|nr:hypothetical protein BU16DRAFT_538418 [Lophium mytilinum]
MTCPLLDLPVELHLVLVDTIKETSSTESEARRDIISLSSTCPYFRSLLSPIVFDRFTLRNDDSAQSVTTLAALRANEHNEHIKHLRFEGSMRGFTVAENGGYRIRDRMRMWPEDLHTLEIKEVEAYFSGGVYDVLSNLHRWFPNLDAVSIHFDVEDYWHFHLDVTEYNSSDGILLEDLQHAKIEEQVNPYRRLMPKLLFFDHLNTPTTTSLSISASDDGPLGAPDSYNFPKTLPLAATHMSALKILHLDGIVLCAELRDFLATHATSLADIAFVSCFGRYSGLANTPSTWAALFEGFASASPTALRRIEVKSHLSSHDGHRGGGRIPLNLDLSDQTEAWLKAGPSTRRCFYYEACWDNERVYVSEWGSKCGGLFGKKTRRGMMH